MDAVEALTTRRSVRAFTQEQVSDEQIETLLRVAMSAPSAGNCQPWRIFVVQDPRTRLGLARAALDQMFVAEAPLVFVVCTVPEESSWRYGRRGESLYCLQDTAALTENLLVAAHAMGLGGCWIGAFDEAAAAEVLKLRGGVRPVALVPVGHPNDPERKPSRRPINQVVRWIRQ